MLARHQTLRRKLLVWLLLPLLCLFSLRAVYTYFYAKELADRVYDRTLYTLANSLAQHVRFDGDAQQARLSDSAHRILLSDEYDQLYYALRNARGDITDGDPRMPARAPATHKTPFYDARIDGFDVRVMQLPQRVGEEVYYIQVAETLAKRNLLAQEFRSGVLVPQLFIILLATVIVWYGIGRSLMPLKRLQRSVGARSHLDLSAVNEQGLPAEVQPLVQAINDLMARLSQALDAQNRFIADAAHQLRTPLAGLKSQIELTLLQDNGTKTLPTQQLLNSTDRMARLVNQLLALARNEPSAEGAIRKQPIDLGQLASEITRAWVPRALEKSIDLGFEPASGPVVVQGDAARLKDLLDNLIDNALRYTPPQGQVTVSLSHSPHPQLSVTDNGPGIPPAERERVFERFYSLLGNGNDGSGLGLAIVKEIARLHGGKVRISDGPDGQGTRVSVSFAG